MKRKIKNLMAVMIALAIVLSMSLMPATALISHAAQEGVNIDMAWEVLDIVNNERVAQGLSPLTMDKGLMDAAQVRAYEIVSQFSHTRPDGTSCFTVLPADYKYGSLGENIAAGQRSAAEVMNSWMNSEGHRANILNGGFQSIGIACVYVPDSVYRYHWVQLFHSRVIDPATRESQTPSEYLTYDKVGSVSVEDTSAIVVAEVSTNGDVIKYVAGHGISSDSISWVGIYETSLHRLTWKFDDLQPSTTYYYQYDVFTASGKDYKSNIYTFTTAAATDAQGPVISDVIINNTSSDGFDVSCRATDDVATDRVSFAVWSDNETNAQWINGNRNGDTYSCRALTSDHNDYTGHYNIHIYAYDTSGNESMTATAGVDVPARVVEPVDESGVAMYRLYNINSGEHFYTANASEMNNLSSLGWTYEGIGWTAPAKSSIPVYRLYNPNSGDHHYTTNISERNTLISIGWNDEGIGWYSAEKNGVPLYREYNPNAVNGTHNYTTSASEHYNLVSLGWRDEGIGWYGLAGGKVETQSVRLVDLEPSFFDIEGGFPC